jgi:hypothetical protein
VGEYKFYNRKNDHWDDSACAYENSTRCVKMDCHLPNTNFTLLGFFKEPNYDEWMEQLFKHEGDCLWTDEEYQFMQDNRDVWPQGCTLSGLNATAVNSYGSSFTLGIYYDIKPSHYGKMDIGLYTDGLCIHEYTGNEPTVEEVVKTAMCGDDGGDCDDTDDDGNLLELVNYIAQWNDAFDVYKVRSYLYLFHPRAVNAKQNKTNQLTNCFPVSFYIDRSISNANLVRPTILPTLWPDTDTRPTPTQIVTTGPVPPCGEREETMIADSYKTTRIKISNAMTMLATTMSIR